MFLISHSAELPTQAAYVLFGREVLDESETDKMSSASDVAADLDEFAEQLLQSSSKMPRRMSGDGSDQRRALPLRLLAMANRGGSGRRLSSCGEVEGGTGENMQVPGACAADNSTASADGADGHVDGGTRLVEDDDDAMPYNNDLRDVNALASYEPAVCSVSPALQAPHAQTSFLLGLSGPPLRGEEQEAIMDHFSPLTDQLPTLQGLTNLDRLPLPRPSTVIGPGSSAPPSPFNGSSPSSSSGGATSSHAVPLSASRAFSKSAPAGLNGTLWSALLDDAAQDEIDDVFG